MGTYLNPEIFKFQHKVAPRWMPPSTPSYHSDFGGDSDMDLYTVNSGEWRVDPEGFLSCYDTGPYGANTGRNSIHMTERKFVDVAVEFAVRPQIDAERDMSVYLRTDGTDQNNYNIGIGSWNYRTAIGKKVAGSPSNLVGVGSYTDLEVGKWYYLRGYVKGSKLKVENLTTGDTLTATDTDLTEGYVAAFVWDGQTSGLYGGDFKFLTVRRL